MDQFTGVTLGSNIVRAGKRLGHKAIRDFGLVDYAEYGTFKSRGVMFHTDAWPRLNSLETTKSSVVLPTASGSTKARGRAKARGQEAALALVR